MICPAVKEFIRACSLVFGAGAILIAAVHMLTPLLMSSPEWEAPYLFLGTWATFLSLLSLSFIALWGARVLLASRGSTVTRALSSLTAFPALYAILIPFAAESIQFRYAEMSRIWDSFLLLAAVTAFFSYPYTRGYSVRERKLFLAWGVMAAANGLQSLLFFLFFLLWKTLDGMPAPLTDALPYAALLLSCGLEAALAFFSAMLAWRLFRNAAAVVSMPDRQDPEMPGQGK